MRKLRGHRVAWIVSGISGKLPCPFPVIGSLVHQMAGRIIKLWRFCLAIVASGDDHRKAEAPNRPHGKDSWGCQSRGGATRPVKHMADRWIVKWPEGQIEIHASSEEEARKVASKYVRVIAMKVQPTGTSVPYPEYKDSI